MTAVWPLCSWASCPLSEGIGMQEDITPPLQDLLLTSFFPYMAGKYLVWYISHRLSETQSIAGLSWFIQRKISLLWSSSRVGAHSLSNVSEDTTTHQKFSLSPPFRGCRLGLSKEPTAFAGGQFFGSFTINVSVYHTIHKHLFSQPWSPFLPFPHSPLGLDHYHRGSKHCLGSVQLSLFQLPGVSPLLLQERSSW